MQIHELNDYSGQLNANAYLAVDNGNDTGKVSARKLLAETNNAISDLESSLNARIDNIIAGGTAPSVAEVTDARLGAYGDTYPSLGDAIRGQISEISSETRNINTDKVGRYSHTNAGVINPFPDSTTILGLSKKIPCLPDTDYTVSIYTPDNTYGTIYVAWYDSDGTFLSETYAGQPQIAQNSHGTLFTSPASAYYLHVYLYRVGGFAIDDNTAIQIEASSFPTPFVDGISAKDDVARTGQFGKINYTEHPGYIDAVGTIRAAGTITKEVYTNRIDVSLIEAITLFLEYESAVELWAACVTYDENGDFIERKDLASFYGANARTKWGGLITDFDSNVKSIVLTYRKYDGVSSVYASASQVGVLNKIIETNENLKSDHPGAVLGPIGADSGRFKPCYDHLFVNNSGSNITIPHESLYHVRISRLMGFNTIEANVAPTSDGVYIVNHLDGGKFGQYFHHVDGVTDISNISVSSVTWSWIASNVRYNSTIEKYQTRPCRLEEFLSECRQQNIIPFIYGADGDVISLADKYMGYCNYVAYGASRADCPDAIIYHWVTKTTKADILAYCESIGKPFIYGMANPTSFSDSDLKDIIDSIHEAGYKIGLSYIDQNWYKYSYLGVDYNGTQYRINRIDNGNICNIDTIFGFGDFNYTNATELDGVLHFDSTGTLEPNIPDNVLSLGGVDLQIEFTGTITISSVGTFSGDTYTSDGSIPFFMSVPIINGSPVIGIEAMTGTEIKDVKIKVSKF